MNQPLSQAKFGKKYRENHASIFSKDSRVCGVDVIAEIDVIEVSFRVDTKDLIESKETSILSLGVNDDGKELK